MRIFHLTTSEEWAAAQQDDEYTVSTRGPTLAQEGYLHCAEEQQVEGVRSRWFADVDDLVLLEIETSLLLPPWRSEQLDGADEPFPHVYGPLNLDAVVHVTAGDPAARPVSPTRQPDPSARPVSRPAARPRRHSPTTR